VVGILTHNGRIDIARMAIVRSVSYPLQLTFHRAFDVCSIPPLECLEQIVSLGCERILTSGRAHSAASPHGITCLRQMIGHIQRKKNEEAHLSPGLRVWDKIRIVAAAGISPENVYQIIRDTGVCAVHAGSSVTLSTSSISASTCHASTQEQRLNNSITIPIPKDDISPSSLPPAPPPAHEAGRVHQREVEDSIIIEHKPVSDFNDDVSVVVDAERVALLVQNSLDAWDQSQPPYDATTRIDNTQQPETHSSNTIEIISPSSWEML
jgi:hypothetical protein